MDVSLCCPPSTVSSFVFLMRRRPPRSNRLTHSFPTRRSSDLTKNGEPNSIPLNLLAISELDRLAGGELWPRHGRVFATSSGAGFTAYAKDRKSTRLNSSH